MIGIDISKYNVYVYIFMHVQERKKSWDIFLDSYMYNYYEAKYNYPNEHSWT